MNEPETPRFRSELLKPEGFVVLLLVISLTFDSRIAQWWFSSLVVTLYIAARILTYRPPQVTVDVAQARH
jgi:hypothetical protein